MEALQLERESREKTNIEKVRKHIKHLDRMVFPDNQKNANQYKLEKDINFRNFDDDELFAIAAHEVRHRVQDEREINLFTKRDLRVLDNKNLRYFSKQNNEGDKKLSKMMLEYFTKEEKRTKKPFDKNEIDAIVTETLIILLLRKGVSKEEIIEFVLPEEPKEIERGLNIILGGKHD